MCRKKARAFPIVAGSGVGKDSMYLGMGVGNFAASKWCGRRLGQVTLRQVHVLAEIQRWY